ncbi:MAG: ECF transporter S component [Clostridia bacterium]|nr:ECF transporter S component [Clostridia bacterium]
MVKRKNNKSSVVKMTELAILTAIVFVLQLFGIAIRLPFLGTTINLVLIPIVLGATVLGPMAGAWLGFVNGLQVFIALGVLGGDPTFTVILFNNEPVMTFLICVVKTTAAGYLSGLVYKLLSKKNNILAMFVSAAVAPIVNTGLFILGCLLIMDTIKSNFVGEGGSVAYFLLIGIAGINFIFEFLVNMIFAPTLNRLTTILNKRLVVGKSTPKTNKEQKEN